MCFLKKIGDFCVQIAVFIRYVILNRCKLKFRVSLKIIICPNAKLGHSLILNTDFGRGRRLRRPEKPQMRVTGCRGRQPLRALRLFSRETNDTFNVGHEYKRYIFRLKMGVVKPKGIFFIALCP